MQQVANSIEWSDRLYVDGAAESGERRRSQREFGRRTSRSPTLGRFSARWTIANAGTTCLRRWTEDHDLQTLFTGARHQGVLRHGHSRFGDLLAQVLELGQTLRGEGHDPRWRHDGQGARPDSRGRAKPLARDAPRKPAGIRERRRGKGV